MDHVETSHTPTVKTEQPDELQSEVKPLDIHLYDEVHIKTEPPAADYQDEPDLFTADHIKSERPQWAQRDDDDDDIKSESVVHLPDVLEHDRGQTAAAASAGVQDFGTGHQCPYCDLETSHARFLRLHMRYAHKENGEPFDCHLCDFETRDRRKLTKHLRNKHRVKAGEGGSARHVTGRGCASEEDKAEGDEDLPEGLDIVDRTQSDFYQCPYCSFETREERYLAHHMRYAHKENGEVFRCDQCEYESNDRRKLTRHVRLRHNMDVFSCERCDFQTRERTSLTAHVSARHSGTGAVTEYRCNLCDFVTCYRIHLNTHTLSQHTQGSGEGSKKGVHRCAQCGLQTSSRTYLLQHLRLKHPKEDSTERRCPHCPYTTRDRDYYRQHLKVKHDETLKPFVCAQCGYTAKLKKQMNRHMRLRHDDSSHLYECHLCLLKTKDKYYFERHNKFIHNDVLEIYRCAECKFESKYKQHLVRHMRLHHTAQAELFRCELCPYTSRNKGNYKEHFRNVHDRTVQLLKCDECEYTTKQKRSLRLHVDSVHAGIPPPHRCDHCDFRTRTKKYLAMHVEVRHPQAVAAPPAERLRCSLCDYSTPHRTYLVRHVRRQHQEQEPVRCSECAYLGKTREALRLHLRAKHGLPRPAAAAAAAASATASATAATTAAATAAAVVEVEELQCPHCPMRTVDRYLLRQHVKLLHREDGAEGPVFKCDRCAFATRNKHYLQAHRRTQHEDSPDYTCSKCRFTTKNHHYYRRHVKLKHAAVRDVWRCRLCPFETVYKTGLRKHVLARHRERFEGADDHAPLLQSLMVLTKRVSADPAAADEEDALLSRADSGDDGDIGLFKCEVEEAWGAGVDDKDALRGLLRDDGDERTEVDVPEFVSVECLYGASPGEVKAEAEDDGESGTGCA